MHLSNNEFFGQQIGTRMLRCAWTMFLFQWPNISMSRCDKEIICLNGPYYESYIYLYVTNLPIYFSLFFIMKVVIIIVIKFPIQCVLQMVWPSGANVSSTGLFAFSTLRMSGQGEVTVLAHHWVSDVFFGRNCTWDQNIVNILYPISKLSTLKKVKATLRY